MNCQQYFVLKEIYGYLNCKAFIIFAISSLLLFPSTVYLFMTRKVNQLEALLQL